MVAIRTIISVLATLAGAADAKSIIARQAGGQSATTNSGSGNASSLVVSTNVGSFQGTMVNSTVRQWLGIRYGAPTNGSRRFRPPQRAAVLPSTEVFDASAYSPSCPQNRGAAFQGFNIIQGLGNGTDGEDCLSLNIWSPSADRLNASTSGTAVLLWIYGGAFTFGSSNTPGYQGDYFVSENDDITIVSINYRTNAFGFPAGALGFAPYDTNLGLRDQRMAIEWVYNNIRNFGGDPERITLFGESAGAASIGAYPYAYQADPIVKGLIMESGSEYLMASELVSNVTAAQQSWSQLANSVGCAANGTVNASSTFDLGLAQLECLQSVEYTAIQQFVGNFSGSVTAFAPRTDNVTVFDSAGYASRSTAGEYAQIPVLIGSNDNEGSILTSLSPGLPAASITLYGFTCPAAAVATSRQNQTVPSWQYRYLGSFPNIDIFPAFGVFHSSEIGLVWGTYRELGNSTALEIATSRAMQGGWVAFARDPQQGLTTYGWPQYVANGETLIQLGGGNNTVSFNSSQAYNANCSVAAGLYTRG